ncbi:MAG: hypothetical protein JOZ62_06040 [Acidobacteriaceae bacterium]|nr:hypothetical protein [Acidobacteriaceae bacterium]
MDIIGPAPEALSNDEIIARYDGAITQLVKACLDSQFEFERQVLVNQARLNWQFIKNNHFNVPGQVSTSYGDIADYLPIDTTGDGGADVKLCPPLNLMGGDLYKFCAVMGQNAPRVKAVSDNPQDADSTSCAQNADINIRDLWAKNKVDRQWKALAFHQYVTGPVFIRGVWNTDAQKYGQTVEPKIDVQVGEDGTPVPVQVGEEAYDNGDAEIRIYSVLEVSIPYEAKSRGEIDQLRCEVMQSKWRLLSRYKGKNGAPGRLEQYRDNDVPDDDYGASTTSAQEARDAVANPSGTGRSKKQNQWRLAEYWLRPHLYESITSLEAREVFQRQFPEGLYIARAGSVTVEIDNRRIEDEWAICRVGRGERLMERPIAADALPIQRAIDDLFGMAIETVLRAITQTIMDSQLIDREAINTKEAVPAEIILTALPVDGDLSKRIFQIPPARLGDQVLPLLNLARQFMQDITGIRPELAGGGQPTSTYREAKQRRDQALMQLAPQADEMRFAAEEVAEILVKLRAKYGAGTVVAQRKGAYGTETDVADMAQLKESGWHAEANDDFPMTLADRRDAVFSLLKDFPPDVQQALSILDPLNIEEIFELIQVPGFESSLRDQKEKTLADIQNLLAEAPMQDPNGGPPQPSTAPDPFDNHAVAAGVIGVWMVSKTGRETRNSNPQGFANVQAFWQAQVQLAQPPPPAPPPPIKGAVSWTGKLEDFPNLVPEILLGSGLPAPAQAPPPAAAATPRPGDMATPAAVDASPVQQASPISPLHSNGVEGVPTID